MAGNSSNPLFLSISWNRPYPFLFGKDKALLHWTTHRETGHPHPLQMLLVPSPKVRHSDYFSINASSISKRSDIPEFCGNRAHHHAYNEHTIRMCRATRCLVVWKRCQVAGRFNGVNWRVCKTCLHHPGPSRLREELWSGVVGRVWLVSNASAEMLPSVFGCVVLP